MKKQYLVKIHSFEGVYPTYRTNDLQKVKKFIQKTFKSDEHEYDSATILQLKNDSYVKIHEMQNYYHIQKRIHEYEVIPWNI